MMTVPFMGVDGEGFKLNYNFNFAAVKGGEGYADADVIKIWNPVTSGYDEYFYYEDDSHEYDGWTWADDIDVMFEDNYENGLQPGSTFWYLAKGTFDPKNPTKNGSVADGQVPTDSYDVDIVAGNLNMLAYPYPMPLFLNNTKGQQIEFVGVKGGEGYADADVIKIWNAVTSGYDEYFYYEDDSHEYDGWTWADDIDVMFEDNYEEGLEIGRPFWYLAKGKYDSKNPITWKCNYTSTLVK